MQLDRINVLSCPFCGSTRIIRVEKSNQHVTGLWNEFLKFDCGTAYSFSPNFRRTTMSEMCSKGVQQVLGAAVKRRGDRALDPIQLKKIPVDRCPRCDAGIRELQIRNHDRGEVAEEQIRFTCGTSIAYGGYGLCLSGSCMHRYPSWGDGGGDEE